MSLGVRASSAAVYCDSQYSQRVMVNVTDSENGGAYILDNFKKAAAMIEEMMRQDGTNAG